MADGADTQPESLSRRFAVCAQVDSLDGVQLGALLERHRPRLVLLADAAGRMSPADLLVCAQHEVDVWALAQPGRPVRAFALRRWAGLPWVRLGNRRRLRERAKRVLDLTLVLASLPLTVPVLAVLVLLVSRTGPPLLFQDRVGAGGRVFRMIKIRSMRTGAEIGTGAVLSRPDDPRVTRAGRWLRRSRLDELPQLWNVLVGQMSLVGPRPERPEFVRGLRALPDYDRRHLVRPGLTGLAQLTGGYDASPEEKLRCDLLYLNSRTLATDLGLLGLTVVEWFRGFPNG